jgi:hypothetical protein
MAADGNDPTGLSEQLNDCYLGYIREVEAGHHPKRKGSADRSLACKCCRSQQKSLAVKNGVLERRKESDDRRARTAQVVLTQRKDLPSSTWDYREDMWVSVGPWTRSDDGSTGH